MERVGEWNWMEKFGEYGFPVPHAREEGVCKVMMMRMEMVPMSMMGIRECEPDVMMMVFIPTKTKNQKNNIIN